MNVGTAQVTGAEYPGKPPARPCVVPVPLCLWG